MPSHAAIKVTGLSELIQGFEKVDRELGKEVRRALRDAGDVVARDAHGRAVREIRHMTEPWSEFRLGMSQSDVSFVVYIVPRQRGVKSGPKVRHKFSGLMLDRAMNPALEENANEIRKELENAINDLHANAHLIAGLHSMT